MTKLSRYRDSIQTQSVSWSLIDSVANYDLADSVEISRVHGGESTDYYVDRMSSDLDSLFNIIVIDTIFNIIYTFEDEESFEGYLDQFASDRPI